MARGKKDNALQARTNRLLLPPRKEPYWASLATGRKLGYYRCRNEENGTWIVKHRDKDTGARRKERLGEADDYSDANGSSVLSYEQFLDKANLWFIKAKRAAELRSAGEVLPEGPFTVGHAVEEYLAEQRREGKRGLQQSEIGARVHILPALGNVEVAKLTRARLKKWISDLAESPRRKHAKRGAKEVAYQKPPSTEEEVRRRRDSANRTWTILRAALNLALVNERVSDGSAWRGKGIAFKDTGAVRVRHLSIPDQVRLVNACAPDFRRLVSGALHTGARLGELLRLEVGDFDPTNGTIHLASNLTKTGKARNIVLTEEGRAFFSSITVGRRSNEILFLRDGVRRRSQKGHGLVWGRGEQAYHLAQACKAAGIPPCNFHQLRHSAASVWLNAGMSLGDVAEQLGDSEATTRKHYIHLCPDALAARVRRYAPTLGINDPTRVSSLKIQGA